MPGSYGTDPSDFSDILRKSFANTVTLLVGITFSFRPVHMIPGQLIAPGQLTDTGVNFASVRSDACNCSHEFFVAPG